MRRRATLSITPPRSEAEAVDFVDLVRARYSLRQYSDFPVADEVVDKCLDAARLAPSACNSQPWSFIAARTPEKVESLAKAAFSGLYSMNAFAAKAPVLIAVVTKRSGYAALLGGMFRGVKYSLIDIGIACEHLALQAAELGLGACMLGWLNERAVKRELGLPRSARIDLMISLGYPLKEGFVPPKKRRSLEEIRKLI